MTVVDGPRWRELRRARLARVGLKVCSTCLRGVEKVYGGEGRYPVECIDCWTAGEAGESATGGRGVDTGGAS